MMKIYQFFRLIRFANLLVIVLTMFIVEFFLLKYKVPTNNIVLSDFSIYDGYQNLGNQAHQISGFILSELKVFLLLILSTVLIAASGNIINDYFDVKADRVNKPNRLIIDKYIKRRWAMMFHWIFSSIGFIIALGVGYELQNVWVPLIAFLSINLLWFYSAYYKRRPLIGNIIVALLIGILPIYVMLYNWPILDSNISLYTITVILSKEYVIGVVLCVSVLAFLQNIVRELVKDIQDVRGDLKLGARTFPIKFGLRKTKWLIILFSLFTLSVSVLFFGFILDFSLNQNFERIGLNEYFLTFLLASNIIYLLSVFLVVIFNKSKTYKIASVLLKLAMLFGLLTPLFL